MSKRKWPVGSFVPCSPRHLHCSPAHAALVRGYREERERQETEHEMILTNAAEYELWRENGGSLVTFKQWLIAHKRSDSDRELEEQWHANERVIGAPDHTKVCHESNGQSIQCPTHSSTDKSCGMNDGKRAQTRSKNVCRNRDESRMFI